MKKILYALEMKRSFSLNCIFIRVLSLSIVVFELGTFQHYKLIANENECGKTFEFITLVVLKLSRLMMLCILQTHCY